MRARWQGNCLWAVALLVLSGWCHAQSVTPEDEYKQLIKVHTGIQPLGEHPFGESINLYNGALSFEVTDVSLPGNGPTLQLSRSLDTTELDSFTLNGSRPFGDWDLDIPRIETATANVPSVTGWKVQATNPLDRCTNFGTPPPVPTSLGYTWDPDQWWYGYHLIIPGEGSQDLLERSTTIIPTSGGVFPAVTKRNWMIRCGVTADDGGEGFVAMAPDGIQYTFAHLVYRPMAAASQGGKAILGRREALMYVTQVGDRFGNTLTYHYDSSTGYLTGITASDGRAITVSYVSGSPHISSITAQASNGTTRTWTYSYDSSSLALTGVQLPDGSAWSYNLGPLQKSLVSSNGGNCDANLVPTLTGNTVTGTATTPSGLTGSFTLIPMMRGRSYVLRQCYGGYGGTQAVYSTFPEVYYQPSISSEVVSGANVPTETWSYSYSPANESWKTDSCASTNSCASTVYIDVTNPGGSATRYTYSNRFDATEGQLLQTDIYSGAVGTTLMRSVVNAYANPTGGPWPSNYGGDLQDRNNWTQTEELAPLSQRQILQSGDTYTWHANAFNAYAQVTDATRGNSISGEPSIEEATTYLNDTNTWVLGLPQTVTNVGTGDVESSNTYNSLDELTARARFGQTLMSYTWNSAGQLASFTDGNNHTTNLGNYYRGIPQSIGYPDGTNETLAVDDLGQITSITDQSGHTTSYSYDAIGRIAQINYPYDSSIDSAQWYPKVFTYAYVTGAERGVGAGHWRRTTTQGSAADTTYFDAELRPVLDDTSNGSTDISTATGYDWRGLTTFAAYPVAGSPDLSAITTGTHSSYDALGRLTQTQQDSELGTLTTATAYLAGAREQVTDPKSNVATTTYQVFDEPDYKAPILVQAPTGITQAITRDVYGNPHAITQSGSYGTEVDSVTKSLYYDSNYRLCRTSEPETGSTIMAYDAANNLVWSAEGIDVPGTETDCAQGLALADTQTTRTYDAMNRVLTIVPSANLQTQSTTYTYDALGHVHTAVSGIATQGFAYNSLGQLTGESLQVNGFTWALGYGYDAYGHRATVSYPGSPGTSEVVNYAPDAWGRPTQASGYATGVGYYPDGHVASFTYVSGASYVADENARHLVSNFSDGTGSALALSEDLTYDPNGNITAVTDLVNGTRSKSYGYDDLNRLTSASAPSLYGTESYTYDPINNLRTRLTQGQTLTYNYDATNKLTSITQGASTIESLGYDSLGDINADYTRGTTLSFDAKHQLTGMPGQESYSYDAAGRRVEKQPTGGSPTYYMYSQAGQLMYQYDPSTATATDFIYLGTKLVGDSTAVQLLQPGGISFGANPTVAGSTTVSWGSVPLATSYILQQRSIGDSTWSTVYSGSATTMTASVPDYGEYVFQVEACIGSDCSAWTTSATLVVLPAIPVITVPTGTFNGPYTVSWTNSFRSSGAVGGYTLQESLNGGAWNTVFTGTFDTSTSRPGNVSGSYTYRVEAMDSANRTAGWSAVSNAVTVNTAYGVIPAPPPILSVPSVSTTGSPTISWTAAAPVTSYAVEQNTAIGPPNWVLIYNGTGTSLALSNLAGGSYSFRVQACNTAGGGSACTGWATAGPMAVAPRGAPTLTAPTGVVNFSPYSVSWSAVASATTYNLQQQVNGGAWNTIQSTGATSWTASGEGDGTYAYRVQACYETACGSWSNTGTLTVDYPPSTAPTLAGGGTSLNGNISLSWNAVANATSYLLWQSTDGGKSWITAQDNGTTSWNGHVGSSGTYNYTVAACDAGGCGPWSNVVAANVTLVPATPGGLYATITVYSSTGAAMSWGSNGAPVAGKAMQPMLPPVTYDLDAGWGTVSGASSYDLQYCKQGGACATRSTTSTLVGGISVQGTNYTVNVRACNAAGCSSWSAPVTPGIVQD